MRMKYFLAPLVLLVVLWIVILQSDEVNGKTVSRDPHELDKRMVRRNRTRISSPTRRIRKEHLRNSAKPVGTTSEDVLSQSEEANAENPPTINEMAMVLNASDNSTSEEGEEVSKFSSSTGEEITVEHVDLIMLRLQHISRSVSNNLTEILALQKKEFALNPKYEEGWLYARDNSTLTVKSLYTELLSYFKNDSAFFTAPEEYHIALIAYTNEYPVGDALHYHFNKATREVCSGNDVDEYNYKSFYKLLELAIKEFNKEPALRDRNRFLYRGIKSKMVLEEGQVVAFQQFVSTSRALNVAELFAGDQTLLEIQGYYDTGLNVQLHSKYYDEKETLFNPLQVFKVDSIHVGNYYTRYVLVGHEWEGIDTESDGKGRIGNIGIEGNDEDASGKTTAAEMGKNESTTNKQVTIIPPSFLLLVGIICAYCL